MKTCSYKKAHIIFIYVFISACKVPYNPPAADTKNHYLIVEGVINSGLDSTHIKLSRTLGLASTLTENPELHAQVSVEDGQSYSYTLKETGMGNYVAGPLGLNNAKQYRLRIKTDDNKVYLSDLAAIKYTPPIDSVGYITNSDLAIYANTHDPANNTRYYKWDFTETWEFTSWYQSNYMTNGVKIIPRPPEANIYYCWQSAASHDIILASSSQLTQDVIYQAPITQIGSSAEKIRKEYSILLKQYALTLEAYTFWDQMKKNTEKLGNIFDAMPSQINGNIHCITNPSEPVFGYLSITNIQTKRIFIYRSNLPQSWIGTFPFECAIPDTVKAIDVATKLIPSTSELIILDSLGGMVFNPITRQLENGLIGYTTTYKACADCRVRGTNIKPTFWK